MAPAEIAYTDALNDWDVKHVPLATFLQHQQQGYGHPDFSACEVLTHDQYVCPYFDVDVYQDHEPTPQEKQDCLDTCQRHLLEMFGSDPSFSPSRVKTAHRHGWVPAKSRWKISWRLWVRGYKILVQHMPSLIDACSTPEGKTWWDTSIYSRRQKLNVVGACKNLNNDHRTLEVDDRSQMQWTLAQRLVGDEQLLDFPESSGAAVLVGSPPEWAQLGEALERAGFRDPRYVGTRPSSITFSCSRGSPCPCCAHTHDSQNCKSVTRAVV